MLVHFRYHGGREERWYSADHFFQHKHEQIGLGQTTLHSTAQLFGFENLSANDQEKLNAYRHRNPNDIQDATARATDVSIYFSQQGASSCSSSVQPKS